MRSETNIFENLNPYTLIHKCDVTKTGMISTKPGEGMRPLMTMCQRLVCFFLTNLNINKFNGKFR